MLHWHPLLSEFPQTFIKNNSESPQNAVLPVHPIWSALQCRGSFGCLQNSPCLIILGGVGWLEFESCVLLLDVESTDNMSGVFLAG